MGVLLHALAAVLRTAGFQTPWFRTFSQTDTMARAMRCLRQANFCSKEILEAVAQVPRFEQMVQAVQVLWGSALLPSSGLGERSRRPGRCVGDTDAGDAGLS